MKIIIQVCKLWNIIGNHISIHEFFIYKCYKLRDRSICSNEILPIKSLVFYCIIHQNKNQESEIFDYIVYYHKQGYPIPEDVCEIAYQLGRIKCLEYFHKNNFELPKEMGSVDGTGIDKQWKETTEYLLNNGCKWQNLIEFSINWINAYEIHAHYGLIDNIKFLYQKNAPMDSNIWICILWGMCRDRTYIKPNEINYHLCIQYLYEINCPMIRKDIYKGIARSDDLKSLMFFKEMGDRFFDIPSKNINIFFYYAIEQDAHYCLKYLHNHGCLSKYYTVVSNLNHNTLCYLKDHEYPESEEDYKSKKKII